MFDAYYSLGRFRYIHAALLRSGLIRYRGPSQIRKTGCLYGKTFNAYIDTSDGVNEDFGINEYCGRMVRVINDAGGKPFVFLKSIFSPVRSRNLVQLANQNGGTIIPFVHWCYNPDFYSYLLPRRCELRAEVRRASKTHDIGLAASLDPVVYPKPNATEPMAAWTDYNYFGIGSPDDTGFFTAKTRKELHDELLSSHFSFYYASKTGYAQYIQKSMAWQSILCPPGVGEYTQRIFDHGFLGQCIILRKSSYDYGYSWKQYIPEIDFTDVHWQDALSDILDHYREWEDRSRYYFDRYFSTDAIVELLTRTLERACAT